MKTACRNRLQGHSWLSVRALLPESSLWNFYKQRQDFSENSFGDSKTEQ